MGTQALTRAYEVARYRQVARRISVVEGARAVKSITEMTPTEMLAVASEQYAEAERKAWDNLRRYKFSNFGYYAARVVFLGQLIRDLGGEKPPNPFKGLVHFARAREAV